MIANHYSATLSALDVAMITNVPPGGNWKNIPKTIPSKRLEQIRESFARGEGSRSTYYGRLRAQDPSYTITTYFNRPGNGCFAHYDFAGGQHRLISQREAARLQSFPDNFIFKGAKGSIYKQIGNAVPPLLAYQIAQSFPFVGQYVDLFCGAGGLALGFEWAGWKSLASNDIEASFLETHSANLNSPIVLGDVSNEEIFENLVSTVRGNLTPKEPLIVLGGPPCQGFSTAGNSRSMRDQRNHLFKSYAKVLDAIKPSHFIFENVPGLLSMEKGKVLEEIKATLSESGFQVSTWRLNADAYAVPQKRQRVFLVGRRSDAEEIISPRPITRSGSSRDLFDDLPIVCGVKDAIGDLPAIDAGEDGSAKQYSSSAMTLFQKLMRGEIKPAEYISAVRSGEK
ncbi:DNA (cytosine-5-)-methyltransferase [Burkholderia arboris]|uniref:DNA (cytosine-5-)-methyltransferase n=1 Tax=Burkholderia arboris TaxID=488730 RepID=UPI0030EFE8FE